MAKSVEEVVPSTPDEEEIEKKPKSKGKVNDGKATSEAEGDGQDGEDDNEEDDEEEEEFEISAILDAKRGYFQNVRFIFKDCLSDAYLLHTRLEIPIPFRAFHNT